MTKREKQFIKDGISAVVIMVVCYCIIYFAAIVEGT